MKIAILSDSHDRVDHLERVLASVKDSGAVHLCFLGDFCAPFSELEIDGLKIALQHYPELGQRLAESGAYDAVFTGHDHQRYQEQIGETLWANPGEIMGRFGTVSYGLFETEARVFEHVIV